MSRVLGLEAGPTATEQAKAAVSSAVSFFSDFGGFLGSAGASQQSTTDQASGSEADEAPTEADEGAGCNDDVVRCPEGHALEELRVGSGTCDMCFTTLRPQALVSACGTCNWCVCRSCLKTCQATFSRPEPVDSPAPGQSPFDGSWQKGELVFQIKVPWLSLPSGPGKSPVELAGDGSIRCEFGQGSFSGFLSHDGGTLTWTNGSVWTRASPISVSPSFPVALMDGLWWKGESYFRIQGSTILWMNGTESNVEFPGEKTIRAEFGQGFFSGSLSDDGRSIEWANGSTWCRTPGAAAPGPSDDANTSAPAMPPPGDSTPLDGEGSPPPRDSPLLDGGALPRDGLAAPSDVEIGKPLQESSVSQLDLLDDFKI